MRKTLYLLIVLVLIIAALFGIADHINKANGTGRATTTVDEMTDANTPAAPESADFKNFHYAYLDDSFDLANGEVLIQGYASGTPASWTDAQGSHDEIKGPVSYTFSTSSAGIIGADGTRGDAVVLYRGSGANLMRLVLFAFVEGESTPTEAATATLSFDDTKVQSLSVDHGIITANLLVISDADKKNLAHYAQTPTEPETLRFRLEGNTLVPVMDTAEASSTQR